jgi:hypothetical protein
VPVETAKKRNTQRSRPATRFWNLDPPSWVLLYIERWLKAPVQMEDGSIMPAPSRVEARRMHALGQARSHRDTVCVQGENGD